MLKADKLSQIYQQHLILKDFSFSFENAAIYGIIGPNGAGKSTLLRLLTGIEKPRTGKVYYNDTLLERPLPEIGVVWQKPYLFQATVTENIAYGLKIRKWKSKDCQSRVNQLLEVFHLKSLKDQWAPRLSGGETASVAIARAIAFHPRILILDEPTANLDPSNTRLVEEVLQMIHEEEKMTFIFVTHDMFQAKRMAEYTLFLEDGKLIEAGPSTKIFNAPQFASTQKFIHGEL